LESKRCPESGDDGPVVILSPQFGGQGGVSPMRLVG
jgi:hypothetical protein